MSGFAEIMLEVWRLLENVTIPIINIPASKFWLGYFVVTVSLIILIPLLRIGGKITK